MSKEVIQAIKAICEEKHIPVESVLSTINQALAAAYRKDFGNKLQNLKVEFNPENMDIKVFDVKEVVEDQELDEQGNVVCDDDADDKNNEKQEKDESTDAPSEEGEEEEERFNPKTQMMISEAKEIKKSAKIGDELVQKLEVPGEFGRMAAQTAKQVIIQRLREAEREVVFNEYKDREGELINGTVQRIERGNVLVDIGQATAIMPQQEQIRGEHYAPGAQLRFYIKSVATSSRGPEVIVSRADKELVRKLFMMEVPEVADGAVELKSISREPGSRSKIAVYTEEENVDPVGSCVGQRGTRVQFIINELGGEKIDIIEWDKDEIAFIKNALSPAKVQNVVLDEKNKTAQAEVLEDQFSLAIGKGGQNVRLASSLVGWKIDIKEANDGVSEDSESEDEDVKTKKDVDSDEQIRN
ncbi:transcription termination factor NusA [Patescibacteria group bacterium]|nr:transcription termination factor NusA [Patescibacteria group bacterium]